METLRILAVGGLLPSDPRAGGGQRVAYEMSETLARIGHIVDYVYTCKALQGGPTNWGNPVNLDSIGHITQFMKSKALVSGNYDIIHIHQGTETSGLCLGLGLQRLLGIRSKLVLSIHAPEVHSFPRSVNEAFTGITARNSDITLSMSEFARKNIAKAYHIPEVRVCVSYGGIDTDRVVRKEWTPKNRGFVLLFCGRFNWYREQKGLDILLRSLPLVVRNHQVRLNVAGSGTGIELYRALAGKLGIEKHVAFLGFINRNELMNLYANADLFVLPSRRESFGMVLIEAMASGLPVVSTKVGAIPEVVRDGETGILVNPDSPRELAEAICTLLDDYERMKSMGSCGRELVLKNFVWDVVAQRVVECYEKVL